MSFPRTSISAHVATTDKKVNLLGKKTLYNHIDVFANSRIYGIRIVMFGIYWHGTSENAQTDTKGENRYMIIWIYIPNGLTRAWKFLGYSGITDILGKTLQLTIGHKTKDTFSNDILRGRLGRWHHSHGWERWWRQLLCAIPFERNDELRANQTGVAAGLGRQVNTNIII